MLEQRIQALKSKVAIPHICDSNFGKIFRDRQSAGHLLETQIHIKQTKEILRDYT